MKKGYKDSKLGVIPEDWGIKKIKDFLIKHKGGAALKPSDFVKNSGFKVIPKKAIGPGGKLVIDENSPTYCSLPFSNANTRNIVDKKYLITTLRDLVPSGPNIGYIVQFSSDEEFILAQGTYGLMINSELNREFLIQFSNTVSFRKVMQRIKVGSTQVHIRNTDYFNVLIPFPPIQEQQKIAEILTTVDDKIELIDQQITETQALKKGLMQQLLTKGIGHREFKDSPLGKIPVGWEVVKLNTITNKIGDGIHATPKYVPKSDIYFVNGNNLVNGKLAISNKTKCVSEEEYLKHYIKLDKGTILMSINGTIGNLALYSQEKVVFGKSAAYISPKDTNLNTYFLYYFLQLASLIKYFSNELTGSTIKNLSLKSIRNAPIFLPPIEEQQKIAEILTTVDDKITLLKEKKVHFQDLKKGLMQQLLTGKIRVSNG